ncbi:Ran-binding protein 3 [Batrachochytrium dendrobatidis]|nr:Ran-binding protein 3 [Batrachochytrium dendrobatidis]
MAEKLEPQLQSIPFNTSGDESDMPKPIDPVNATLAKANSSMPDFTVEAAIGGLKEEEPPLASSILTEKRKRCVQESPIQKKVALEAETGQAEAKSKAVEVSHDNTKPTFDSENTKSPMIKPSAPSSPTGIVAETAVKLEQQTIGSPKLISTPPTSRGIQQSSLGLFSGQSDKQASQISHMSTLSAISSTTGQSSFGSFATHKSDGLTFGSASSQSVSFASILASTPALEQSSKLSTDSFACKDKSGLNSDSTDQEISSDRPITAFSEPMTVVTGEEDETTIHSTRCKLYAWDGENWRERGTGQIKINEGVVTGDTTVQRRLVMRADGVYRVILNVRILPSMPFHLRDDKYVEAVACEKPPSLTKFLFKFASNEVASSFLSSLEQSTCSLE